MQNESTLTIERKYNPVAVVKQELKELIKDFPNRYGYAKKVVERLKEKKKYEVEVLNVFNVIHSKTYYDEKIALEIQALHDEYTASMNETIKILKAKRKHAGSSHNS